MAKNRKGAEKQPEARKPAFERAEEYILKMVLAADDAVTRLQGGDLVGMTFALGAVKAGAVIAIGNLREAETGAITTMSIDEITSALRKIKEEKH
jgi:hypothetical protein